VLREHPGKIEPVALQIGYGSKKSFYDVFERVVGMTPTAFRRLPSDEARRVIDSVASV
jgi:AraC-like DNA-binding protein